MLLIRIGEGQRLQSWKNIDLFKAGKEILLKTVAQSIPNYAMRVFLLLLDLCAELERMMNSFWWGNSRSDRSGIHWISWDQMCKKKSCGGMGFRKIHEFNLVLLGNQAWQFLKNQICLCLEFTRRAVFQIVLFLKLR